MIAESNNLKIIEELLVQIRLILKEELNEVHYSSPIMFQRQAAKFLKIGSDRLTYLVVLGEIRERYDTFGRRIYLKHELIEYLEKL